MREGGSPLIAATISSVVVKVRWLIPLITAGPRGG
jgi:hypothetical protein